MLPPVTGMNSQQDGSQGRGVSVSGAPIGQGAPTGCTSDLTTAPSPHAALRHRCEARTLPDYNQRSTRFPVLGAQLSRNDMASRPIVAAGMLAPKVTIVAARWFQSALRGRAPLTLVHHEGVLRRGAMEHLSDLLMSEVTVSMADAMLCHIAETRGPCARNHARNQCSQIWRWAARQELWHGANPWAGAGKLPAPNRRAPVMGQEARRLDSLCWEAFDCGLRALVTPVFGAFFLLILRTALRNAEARSLKWSQIDWHRSRIVLEHHKGRARIGTKYVPLVPTAVDLLRKIQAREWSSTYIFPSRGDLVSHSGHIADPWKSFARLRLAAGCQQSTIHDIRHGFAQAMHDAGADLKTVGGMLGHASVRTTEIYVREASIERVATSAADAVRGLIG